MLDQSSFMSSLRDDLPRASSPTASATRETVSAAFAIFLRVFGEVAFFAVRFTALAARLARDVTFFAVFFAARERLGRLVLRAVFLAAFLAGMRESYARL